MATLYDFELDPACYRVRLLLGLLGRPYEVVPVDVIPGREQDSEWFRKISPDGVLPVLDDAGMVAIGDAAARQLCAGTAWLDGGDELERWLGFARRLTGSSGRARWIVATAEGEGLADLRVEAHRLLRELDEHLWFAERDGQDWLIVGDAPTLGDIAVFAEVALCEEGGVSRQDYPAIRRWLDRVKRLSGFVTMSGVFPAGPGR